MSRTQRWRSVAADKLKVHKHNKLPEELQSDVLLNTVQSEEPLIAWQQSSFA